MKTELASANFTEQLSSFTDTDRERILSAFGETQGYSAAVASILLDLGMDADTIVASLLRGLPEPVPESVLDQYGPDVERLIQGLKKLDSLKTNNKTISEAQNIRNMLFALTGDIRVLFIKLAEKLHALRVLDASTDDERKVAARECLDIYAPIADRLGISWIKNEMEDLALKFLNRETYQQIKDLVAAKRGERKQFLEFASEIIKAEAEAAGISVEVDSRAKHFYSVYMKMRKRGKSAAEIYDLSGIRVICSSVENCYTLLGIVHRLWKPVNGYLRDYIARPKPNGYQSLHTSVMVGEDEEKTGEGRRLEIQIRTGDMHQIAEHGVASHWLYKKGSSKDMVQAQDISVVNKLKDWKQSEGAGELSPSWFDDIKQEILRGSVYVLTPQGKVLKLTAGATPIDFAYQIHTAVGEHCIGAKANGSIVPLSSPLKNTQVLEIFTSPSAHPHQNWLELAKSPKTRSKIRSWLEKNDESHNAEKIAETKKKLTSETHAAKLHAEKVSPVQRILQPLTSVLKVRIGGEKNMMIRFARCCNPVTGDSIIGYVSRGRGIIIHRSDCKSVVNNPEFENRIIEAEWETSGTELVKRFRIEAKSSAKLFSEIEGAIRKHQGHLIEGRLEETSTNRLSGIFTMQLAEADDLKSVMRNIRGIPGILEIQILS